MQSKRLIEVHAISKIYYPQLEKGRKQVFLDILMPKARCKQSSNFVVKNIDFSMNEHDKVLIVGKPKSGKTTLARIFAGLSAPTTGKCRRNGSVRLIQPKVNVQRPLMTLSVYARTLLYLLDCPVSDVEGIVNEVFSLPGLGLKRTDKVIDIDAKCLRIIQDYLQLTVPADVVVFDSHLPDCHSQKIEQIFLERSVIQFATEVTRFSQHFNSFYLLDSGALYKCSNLDEIVYLQNICNKGLTVDEARQIKQTAKPTLDGMFNLDNQEDPAKIDKNEESPQKAAPGYEEELSGFPILCDLLKANSLTLMDIGPFSDLPFMLRKFGRFFNLVICEPNSDTPLKDFAHSSWKSIARVRVILGKPQGNATLYIPKQRSLMSLLALCPQNICEYHNSDPWTLEKIEQVSVQGVDDVISRNGLPRPDVIKIEMQGTETEVLRSAEVAIQSCLVVLVKVMVAPFFERQSSFAEVDDILTRSGFILTDIKRVKARRNFCTANPPNVFSRPELVWVNLLYFKKFRIGELIEDQNHNIRLLLTTTLLGYTDFGLSLLKGGMVNLSVDHHSRLWDEILAFSEAYGKDLKSKISDPGLRSRLLQPVFSDKKNEP